MNDQPAGSPTFAEARQRRASLHRALVEAEEALSGPAAGREEDWTREVVEALSALRAAIEEHIELAERPEGLYDEILQKAPRMAGAIDLLRDEHPILRDVTSDIIAKLRTTPVGTTWTLADARDGLQQLLGQLVKHRQLGPDLLWEAYNLDIGGVD